MIRPEQVAFVSLPYGVDEIVALSRAVEDGGFRGIGIADSPVLYGGLYPSVSVALAATSRIRVGPNVTNPVSAHWTVHAGAGRTYAECAPGRYVLGLAAGDGAVHGIGALPARLDELAEAIRSIRTATNDAFEVFAAASGPRSAAGLGAVASSLLIATGAEPSALRELGERARSAASGPSPEIWGMVYLDVVPEVEAVPAAMERAAPIAMSMSRFSLAVTHEGKHVPASLSEAIRSVHDRYRFEHHAADGENPNVAAMWTEPDAARYLMERYCVVGTPEQCAGRLDAMLTDGDLSGIWVAVGAHDACGTVSRLSMALLG